MQFNNRPSDVREGARCFKEDPDGYLSETNDISVVVFKEKDGVMICETGSEPIDDSNL